MSVTFIRAARSRGYICIGLADGEQRLTLTVRESDYVLCGSPRQGDTVDGRTLDLFTFSDECYRATLAALRMLSFSDSSERTLTMKLVHKGISRGVAESAVREMVRLGYINEREQLLRLVAREAASLRGPVRIAAKLGSKGYKRGDIEWAIDSLVRDGQVDFDENARLLVEKKLTRGATDDEIKALLYKNGYKI